MTDFLTRLVDHFAGLEDRLNALDAVIGDGDHGTSICRGLTAAAADPQHAEKAFRRAAGGASGSLFGALIGALAGTSEEAGKPGPKLGLELGPGLDAAIHQISALGGAKSGDKTMLDALIPAADEIRKLSQDTATTPDAGDISSITGIAAAAAAAAAARAGAEATRDMAARRGRAKYTENAGRGALDAGAVSVAEILEVFDSWKRGQ